MINFKFLKVQLKNTWIILIFFCLAAILIFSLDLIGSKSLSSYSYKESDSSHTYNSSYSGAGEQMLFAFIVPLIMILGFTLINILIYKLFIKEINRGYIGSWLTLPLSKNQVYITKIFMIVMYLLIYQVVNFSFQEVIFSSTMLDFSGAAGLYFFTLNISMFITNIIFFGFSLFLVSKFDKHVLNLTLSSVIGGLFVIFYIIYIVSFGFDTPFKNFRYITILSLIQDPLVFDEKHPIKIFVDNHKSYQYNPIIFNSIDLSWKLTAPLLIIIPTLIFSIKFLNAKSLSI